MVKKKDKKLLHLKTEFIKDGEIVKVYACDRDNDIADDKIAPSLGEVTCSKCRNLFEKKE